MIWQYANLADAWGREDSKDSKKKIKFASQSFYSLEFLMQLLDRHFRKAHIRVTA